MPEPQLKGFILDRVLLLGYKPLHVAALAKKLLDAVRPVMVILNIVHVSILILIVETQNSDTFSFCTN